MENKISVIIPARNEAKNIKKLVGLIKKQQDDLVDEIIVVDNGSTDSTYEQAKNSGATVLQCENPGKGHAMEKGFKQAKNEILVCIDADIDNYAENIIRILANPIIDGKADFVKSMFDREGGRVTQLVAKPMLRLLYPEMYRFAQPLAGMIAGKKSFFQKIELEKHYGVDIGIVLDMIKMNAKIEEVYIGKINNMSHYTNDINKLEQMAYEVMETILKKSRDRL